MLDAHFDEWPIVRLRSFASARDEELHSDLQSFREEVCSREMACAVLLDLRDCRELSVAQRRMIGSTLLEMDTREFIVACALVYDPTRLPALLAETFLDHRPRFPVRKSRELAEAEKWLEMLTETPANDSRPSGHAPETREQESSMALLPELAHPILGGELERAPQDGSWIVHCDAKRNRDMANELVEILRESSLDAFLCERQLNGGLSLWLGWTGPFRSSDDAFAARDELAKHGIQLTVSRWAARSA
jgi:hypothetical protein